MNLPIKIDNDAIGKKLESLGASPICPYCGKSKWTLPPEAALIPQWTNVFPAPGVPATVLICVNCGNIRMHALGILNMLPSEPKEGQNG